MRSALVQTEELADFARYLRLGNALRLGRGEIKTGGMIRSSLLCDAFEALIGAIYLDQGLAAIRSFLNPLLEVAVDDILEMHKNEDPKSKLQEWSQSLGYPPPKYVTLKASGPDHSKLFEVEVYINKKSYARGSGKSKQSAEKDAAKKALERIYQE
jgi:ribonuclease-3